jgi:hypothetical protein
VAASKAHHCANTNVGGKASETSMRTNLNFENEDTKELLSRFDFDFFVRQNAKAERYSQADMDVLYSTYEKTLGELRVKFKKEKKQANLFLEGQVRKMFTGGFLPALFELDEGRKHTMFDFKQIGHDLAFFKLWQEYYKKRVTTKKIWTILTRVGSVLAIILSVIKLWETFLQK